MILKETLVEVSITQHEILLKTSPGVIREKLNTLEISPGFALVISGIRRCGKSTLLRQMVGNQKKFNYLNFEDMRIFGFEASDFPKLNEIFDSKPDDIIYFFDELQNVKDWERYIRNLTDQKMKVVITGSNASMLSRELGTKLTGRHLRYELFPFSYNEYLTLENKKASLTTLEEYILRGGFPEYLKTGNELILQELFNDIITRDIIVRHGLRNDKIVKDLALYLLSNIGKEFTYNSLKKIYNLGSVNTIISLMGYFEDSYLLFTLPQFDYSYKKQLVNPKKVYAVDSGLINANTVSFSKDKGRLLENLSFLQLKRHGDEIYYFRQKKECDFIVRDNNKKMSAIQVCYTLTEENKEREMAGLVEALEYLDIDNGLILTAAQEDEFVYRNKKIKVLPAWQWLSI
jgi:hypothetical protein